MSGSGLASPVSLVSNPAAVGMDGYSPAMKPSVQSVQGGMIPYFRPDAPVVRGGSDTEEPLTAVYVGADIPARIVKKLGQDLVRVRTKGIRTKRDIDHAIAYLEWLHPMLKVVFRDLKIHNVSIELGPPGLTYSYAKPTFGGLVDRNSPDFAHNIVVERGATPEVLLHEAMHALPLDVIRSIDSGRFEGLFESIPELPAVNPADSFSVIRQAIFENIRMNETISFGSECYVYECERGRGIRPIFNAQMMADLDRAWSIHYEDWKKWAAIRATFPQYLPHYEERLTISTILLALIVKVEGRTELTDEEFARIQEGSRGEVRLSNYLEYFQGYLDTYVRKRKLDVPPEFFSIEAIMGRTGVTHLSSDAVAQLVESIFRTLEVLEEQRTLEELPISKPLADEDVPPQASHVDRTKLFVAYSGVVDRFLENPPASLSREELASLVSYVRMAPPQVALELASRLGVFLGAGLEDLRVTLGLILYEKGFQTKGQEMVSRWLDLAMLPGVLPHVQRIMGPAVAASFIRDRAAALEAFRESFAEGFRIVARDQFMWFGGPWEESARELFEYPDLFASESWADVGTWIFEHSDDVDSTLDEGEILALERSAFGRRIDTYAKERGAFVEMLARLREDSSLDRSVREAADESWNALVARWTTGFAALGRLMALGGDYALLDGSINVQGGALGALNESDLESVFRGIPTKFRRRAITLVQTYNNRPWSYPDEVQPIAVSLVGENTDDFDLEGKRSRLLKNLMNACIRKRWRSTDLSVAIDRVYDAAALGLGTAETHDLNEVALLPPGFEDTMSCLGLGYSFRAAGDYFYESHALAILAQAIHLVPGDDARTYLEQALRDVQGLLKKDWRLDDLASAVIRDVIVPFGVYFFLQAAYMGRDDIAEQFFDVLFREVPTRYPPDKTLVRDAAEDKTTYGAEVRFLRDISFHEWVLRMEMERLAALRDGTADSWLRRIHEEIARGGHAVTARALAFFAGNMIREDDIAHVEDLCRLMIRKSLMQPNEENVSQSLRAIQESPLDDAMKDELLEGFVARLVEMASAFRGMDLTVIRRLQGLFPWRTPFMRAHDIPYYPRTEGLVIEKLAGIDELIEPGRGKDDRVRLAAFSAAGLPLQRYARWTEELFTDAGGPAELKALGLRKNYWGIYRDLGLPHPYTIPAEYAPDDVASFLVREGRKMGATLMGRDVDHAQAVLRLMERIMGSELRYLLKKLNEGVVRDLHSREIIQEPRGSVDVVGSRMAEQVFEWLRRQSESDEKSPYLDAVREMLFAAGPREVRRLDQALAMLDWPLSRQEKRRVFEQATRHLIFSKRMRRRLVDARDYPEPAEMDLYRLLLSLHYAHHPGNMVSDFLFARLEESIELRETYARVVAGERADNPLIHAEIGLSRVEDELSSLRDKTAFSVVERLELVLNAHRFLRTYMEHSDRLDYCDGFYFQFKPSLIARHIDIFRPYVGGVELEHLLRSSSMVGEGLDMIVWRFESRMREFSELLSETDIVENVSRALDGMYRAKDDETLERLRQEELQKLDKKIAAIEDVYGSLIAQELEDRLSDVQLPDFIEEREGLERSLLIWVMESLGQAQRELLNRELETAESDRERLLALGKAAHLEKLMQLGSVHPAVPPRYQELFSVFQEDVPHRDPIDVHRTIALSAMGGGRDTLVVGRPIKEGTIGGVYEATFEGRDLALKVIPIGKEQDVRDSLRLVRDVRRFLWASRYAERGVRTVDDLLAFYERTIDNELDLILEESNGRALANILPLGFECPEYIDQVPIEGPLPMERIDSRRLKDLSPPERADVFRRVDEELIPTMLAHGVVHFDLHPGNIGVTDDGTVILYDAGRVVVLGDDERATLMTFYNAVQERRLNSLPDLLRRMGMVRDEKAFKDIGELLAEMMAADDPLAALEDMYSRLADYGYVLGDTYIKVLFTFITWRGTKKSFGAE